MQKKNKFKPLITRVKLNPEQAVLTCSCYSVQRSYGGAESLFVNTPVIVVQYCIIDINTGFKSVAAYAMKAGSINTPGAIWSNNGGWHDVVTANFSASSS